jgi:hypothetical protein
MPANAKSAPSRTHPRESSMMSLLSGWAQQGVNSFFATQRILLDLAMRQNASVINVLRERLSDPHHSPSAILSELAGEGMTNFITAQEVLLNMAQQQNKIFMNGVRERFADSTAAAAMADLVRRSAATFIDMQHEFLKIAGKQTHKWLEAAKSGKGFKGDEMVDLAREGMDNFVRAQKRFLDVVAEETTKAVRGKRAEGRAAKVKKTELAELARQATESFVEAQKKLFDVAGRQMNINLKAAGQTMQLVKPLPVVSLADLTREGVRSFIDAQRALMDVMSRPRNGTAHQQRKAKGARRAARPVRKEAAQAATA